MTRVGGTGALQCEEQVVPEGEYRSVQCRFKAKYVWVRGEQRRRVCGTHANTRARHYGGKLEALP